MCVCVCDVQANNSTNTTEDAEVQDTVAFPYDLYNQASRASVSHQLSFCHDMIFFPLMEKMILLYLLCIFLFSTVSETAVKQCIPVVI